MSSSNRAARIKLEHKYGKKCMIEALGIRYIPKSERRKIKGYNKYQDQLTFHHILEKSKGGKATEENGAVIKGYNHSWLHTLPESEKQQINQALQEYKLRISTIEISDTLEVEGQELSFDFKDTIDIKLHTITPEMNKKRKKFNRAKIKEETQKRIKEELDYEREY